MPIFSKDNKTILFLHIPKAAGSSVENIGSSLGWRESFSIRGKTLEDLKYFKASLQHLHAEPLEILLNFDEFDSIFTVVRNPFARFKSEYYWQRAQRITDLGVDEWIAETFEKYCHNSYIYDNHIRPQVEFLPDSKKLQVFKLEEGGVEEARKIFLNFSHQPGKIRSLLRRVTAHLAKEKQGKRSMKNPEIETKFAGYYDRIVEFYQKDYRAFSYKQ